MPMRRVRLCDAALDRIEATDWAAWNDAAETQLESVLQDGWIPEICLSPQYQPTKPDLYHVNLHLSGAERWADQWETQKAIFCMRLCASHDLPVAICGDCAADKLKQLLSIALKFTSLPELIWRPEQATRDELLEVCRIVFDGRSAKRDGIPPVLTVAGEEASKISLPHLTVEILS